MKYRVDYELGDEALEAAAFERNRRREKNHLRESRMRVQSCSKKLRFPDLESAKEFRKGIRYHQDERRYDETDIYQCPNCNGYHFANRAKRRNNGGNDRGYERIAEW